MRFFLLIPGLVVLAACAGGDSGNTAMAERIDTGKKRVVSNDDAGATQTERTMRMAERALAEGKPEMAIVFYRTAALADPSNPAPRLASAGLFEKTGEYAAAAGMYEQLAQELGDNALWLDAGRNHLKANQAGAAMSAYQRAVEASPKDARALNGLAVSHDLKQQHKAAQDLYEKAYESADSKLQNGILVNWGLSLMLSGEAGQAVQKLEPAVNETDLPSLRQVLAIAYGLSGQKDKAKQLGLTNPPTYDDLRASIREYGMAGPTGSGPQAAPVGEVVTVPPKSR